MSLFIYSSIQHIVQREWQSLIPFEDKLILLPHLTYCSEGGGVQILIRHEDKLKLLPHPAYCSGCLYDKTQQRRCSS